MRKSEKIFSGILYRADCRSKLWFHFNQKNPDIRYFSCSNYKSDRGTCEKKHYIREDALEEIVLSELRKLAEFLRGDEESFAKVLEQKSNKELNKEKKLLTEAMSKAEARKAMLLTLVSKVYEDNVSGKISDGMFMQLSAKYETEQQDIAIQLLKDRERIGQLESQRTTADDFVSAVRGFMAMSKLTPSILHRLIDCIDVYAAEGTGNRRTQRVVIHYRFIGTFDIPTPPESPDSSVHLNTRKGVSIEYLPNKPM